MLQKVLPIEGWELVVNCTVCIKSGKQNPVFVQFNNHMYVSDAETKLSEFFAMLLEIIRRYVDEPAVVTDADNSRGIGFVLQNKLVISFRYMRGGDIRVRIECKPVGGLGRVHTI